MSKRKLTKEEWAGLYAAPIPWGRVIIPTILISWLLMSIGGYVAIGDEVREYVAIRQHIQTELEAVNEMDLADARLSLVDEQVAILHVVQVSGEEGPSLCTAYFGALIEGELRTLPASPPLFCE